VDGYGAIEVRGARENNLRDVSLDIPKRALTVVTGVSGSGKSSLVFDTVAAESQRLINETYSAFAQNFLPHHGRPDVDSMANLSAAIVVDQARMGANARSTVGTATDAAALLRILYSRAGEPRVWPASALSFNDPAGMCPECEGLGRSTQWDLDALFDTSRSLDEDPIRFPGHGKDSWPWTIIADSGFFDRGKKLRDYTDDEWRQLLWGEEVKLRYGKMNLTYQGLLVRMTRSFLTKDPAELQPHVRKAVERTTTSGPCTACGGSRLNQAARDCRIDGVSIADCGAMQIDDLLAFVRRVRLPAVQQVLDGLAALLGDLVHIGLGYLSLDRSSASLSGGESQRVRMVRHLGSSLTDITYVFDEPTVGLHAHDVQRLNELLLRLRDKGNTVIVVEHEPETIAIADHVVDMGPGAGWTARRAPPPGPCGSPRPGCTTCATSPSTSPPACSPSSPGWRGRARARWSSAACRGSTPTSWWSTRSCRAGRAGRTPPRGRGSSSRSARRSPGPTASSPPCSAPTPREPARSARAWG
jgi:excinuclease UvrABC ATPase subunit